MWQQLRCIISERDQEMDGAQNGNEYLKALKEQHDKDRPNFDDYLSFLEKKARETGTPLSGQFELTPLCNFGCKMCYVHLEKEQLRGRSILSTEQWKEIMHQAVEAGMLFATLTGGECLTYPGFKELYLFLQGQGCQVSVMTNGFLLDEKQILFFADHRPYEIQITLYGGNNETYERVTGKRAFKTVMDHAKLALKAQLPLTIALTPNSYEGKGCLDTVRAACDICGNIRINTNLFQPREETCRAGLQEDLETDLYIQAFKLLETLNGRNVNAISAEKLPEPGGPYNECERCGVDCGAGRSCFSMTWQGKMIPCNQLDMIESDPFHFGFREAWVRINDQVSRLPRVQMCESCPYKPSCFACAGDLLPFALSGKKPDQLCQRTVAFVREGIWHLTDCE